MKRLRETLLVIECALFWALVLPLAWALLYWREIVFVVSGALVLGTWTWLVL